jgi:hypothetical protein
VEGTPGRKKKKKRRERERKRKEKCTKPPLPRVFFLQSQKRKKLWWF